MSEYDARELQKELNTDFLYAAVNWEPLGERSLSCANECAGDSVGTSFDRGWDGVGEGGEEGSCCEGEELHVWS